MKSILKSLKPKVVANILNGDASILITKEKPKCDLPIDVYIYCTKDKKDYLCKPNEWGMPYPKTYALGGKCCKNYNGKVVAKFTLNKVEDVFYECGNNGISINGYKWFYTEELDLVQNFEKASCLNENELFNYLQPKEAGGTPCGYAWHISNLKIFDRPKELWQFKTPKNYDRYQKELNQAYKDDARIRERLYEGLAEDNECANAVQLTELTEYLWGIKKAPQSWCYVEELL